MALNGIKSAIRKCVKAVTDEFAPVIPGLLIPIAVFVADEDGRSYRSTKNLTIRELKVAIALLKEAIRFDTKKAFSLEELLMHCLSLGADDEDIVGNVLTMVPA